MLGMQDEISARNEALPSLLTDRVHKFFAQRNSNCLACVNLLWLHGNAKLKVAAGRIAARKVRRQARPGLSPGGLMT
jgi:hypothetical protein